MLSRILRLSQAGMPSTEGTALPGSLLSHAIWLSGLVKPVSLCAGLGRCGRCRVRFLRNAPPALPAEEERLSPQELAQGWRLACRRQISDESGPLDLELPANLLGAEESQLWPALNTAKNMPLVLAVDAGTTSVQWRALAAAGQERGQTVAQGGFLNPQAGSGADVMSRLAFAAKPQGRRLLAELLREALRRVVQDIAAQNGRVERLCLAANTAMTDIFLDRDVSGLAAAPYRIGHDGNELVSLPDLPPVYIPPLPAPFVGGDASAALLALLQAKTPRPFVLADLGTNVEMILVSEKGEIYMTSVPLGPALEGIGMECGCLAGPRAATSFTLTPTGLAAYGPDSLPLEAGAALGVSATGYISLLALLRRAALLDESGRFVAPEACAMPLARRIAAGLTRVRGQIGLPLPGGLRLTSGDVEELLKVKAAFALALEKLLVAAGGAKAALLCLAGALGEHVNSEDMAALGFMPSRLAVRIVGNAALDGAAILALDPQKGTALARLCRRARQIFPAQDPEFQQEYIKRIHLRDGNFSDTF